MATRVRCLPIRASWPAPPATMPRSSLTLRWRLGWLHCTGSTGNQYQRLRSTRL